MVDRSDQSDSSFGLFQWVHYFKEDLLKNGKLVLLELAPVDPRSLMQGDYMSLRYKISEGLKPDSMAKQGYCVVKQDANGIAQKQHFQNEKSPLSADELLIKYHYADQWNIHIGAESYFFQEGQSEKYQKPNMAVSE